jgi:hypothetical protein
MTTERTYVRKMNMGKQEGKSLSWSRNSKSFRYSESSPPYSQQPATGSCREPVEPSSHPKTVYSIPYRFTKRVDVAIRLYTRIREVLSSNLGRAPAIMIEVCHSVSQTLPTNAGIVSRLYFHRFLPNDFQ